MKNKKILLISIFLLTLLTISAVSAEDNSTYDIVDVEDTSDEIVSVEKTQLMEQTKNEEILADAADGTFTDLKSKIDGASNGSTISLDRNYVNDGEIEIGGIIIDKPLTINGNGHTINGNNQARIFNITSSNVILKNISFVNCLYSPDKNYAYGGAIYWSGDDGQLLDCTFANCSAYSSTYQTAYNCAGAIYWEGKDGVLRDCTFSNCSSKLSNQGDCCGGAVYWAGYSGTLTDCNFIDCFLHASYSTGESYGGAVYWTGSFGTLSDCNFKNCFSSAGSFGDGGAIRWCGDYGTLKDSNFTNNSADYSGGAIDIAYAECCNIYGCKFVKCSSHDFGGAIGVHLSSYNNHVYNCTFEKCSAGDYGGGVDWSGSGSLRDCNFSDCHAYYAGGSVYWDGNYGTLSDCNFVNSSCNAEGGAVYWREDDGELYNCNFIKSNANEGGAVYWYGKEGELYSCNFVNSSSKNNGGAVYWFGGNGTLSDTSFVSSVSKGNGGAVYWYGDDGVISQCEYSKNTPKKNDIYIAGKNVEVIESLVEIDAKGLTKYYGGSEKYTVTLTNNSSPLSGVTVDFTLNDKPYSAKTNSKGQASIDVNLSAGTYDVIASYDGKSVSKKVTVKSTVTTSDSTGTYLNSKVSATFLNASGKALANTKVSFKVGSKTYTATTNNNGVATASVDLDVGTYTVTAINPKNNEQKTSKLTISKAKSTVTLTATSNNGVVTLTASLSPSTASGNVIFNINNKNYTAKISSAKASQTITGLNVGNYTAKASYAGDKNLNSSIASTKVEVKKVTPTKIIYEDMQTGPVPKSEGRIGNYFCVKLVDDKGKAISGVPIKIGFNGVIYNRTTLSDGSARLQINLANEDLYTFAICFLGDDDYQAAFEVAKIDVNKKYPKPNLANKTTDATNASATQHESRLKTYINYSNMDTKSVLKVEGRAGEYFVVKLLDNNKKPLADVPIKIGFNGVIYNRTTNATGQARLQINLLKPTLYTFAIAYLGDSKYQAAFEVAKITVKAQTPKLTTSSKTFKASAKTKSLSATLVSARGAAISGQKVSFTVNGKTYTGKTNSKGVATVNISLNKKGTYACTVKFAGMTGASAKTTKTAVKII